MCANVVIKGLQVKYPKIYHVEKVMKICMGREMLARIRRGLDEVSEVGKRSTGNFV